MERDCCVNINGPPGAVNPGNLFKGVVSMPTYRVFFDLLADIEITARTRVEARDEAERIIRSTVFNDKPFNETDEIADYNPDIQEHEITHIDVKATTKPGKEAD